MAGWLRRESCRSAAAGMQLEITERMVKKGTGPRVMNDRLGKGGQMRTQKTCPWGGEGVKDMEGEKRRLAMNIVWQPQKPAFHQACGSRDHLLPVAWDSAQPRYLTQSDSHAQTSDDADGIQEAGENLLPDHPRRHYGRRFVG